MNLAPGRDPAEDVESTCAPHQRLHERVAVVTGGGSQIGRAVALALAREGAHVVISVSAGEEDDGKQTVRLIRATGRRALLVPTDLAMEPACRALIYAATTRLGRIDILVNNVSCPVDQPRGVLDTTTEQLDRAFRTNLYSVFWLSTMALPFMRRGSSVINTSSTHTCAPSSGLLIQATQAGIIGFTRELAASVSDRGIRVNAVAAECTQHHPVDVLSRQNAAARPDQISEVAAAHLHLASAQSRPATGEVITVPAGRPVSV